jgi:DhnA family fructose-bisphosphate aldolase class Ia
MEGMILMSTIGKQIRLSQILNPASQNAVVVAMDHAAILGPIPGILDPRKTVELITKGKPDTFFMPAGAVKLVYPYFIEHHIPFLLSIDTCVEMGPEPDYFMLSDSVMHAVQFGASGVSMHVMVGAEKTSDMLKGLAKVAEECDNLGMPLLAIMYPSGFEKNNDVSHVKWAARIGSELGADIVKTHYTGSIESFAEVTATCPVPVMLSGGPASDDPRDFLLMLKDVMVAGGRGCAVGRNLWQNKDPLSMLEAIKAIVHRDVLVDDAAKFLK